jgi:HD-GYP domain-containing protein (c-di-GMP phosphodiesterase class II)
MESQGPTRGAEGIAASRWRSRSWAARVVRGVTVLVPLGAGLVAARAVAPVLAHPRGLLGAVIFLAQVAVVSTTAATCTDRFTRRLLPLAALLRMSLVFPDEAPSRFKTALRAGSSKRLEADMRRARTQGLDGMPHADAAATLLEMLSTLGKHDRLTRGHTERVRAYSEMIAEEMQLSREDRDLLRWGVLIHDVGKLAVPGAILNKNGRPTDEEWEILKSHPAVGGRLVEPLAGWLGEWRLAASEHHERFDGKGYPRGLVGAEISLAGRIVAVADVMTS